MARAYATNARSRTADDNVGSDIREFVKRREAILKDHLLRMSQDAGLVIVNDGWVSPREFTRRSLERSLLHLLHTVEFLLVITGIFGLSYGIFMLLDSFAG